MPQFNYTVDDEPQTTSAHELTAKQILGNAGIDATTHYLVQIEGSHRVSYENDLDKPIHMHEHMKFISVSMAPTPVS